MAKLQQWAATSAADLALASALWGQPLEADTCLDDVMPGLIAADAHGQPILSR